MGCVTLDELVNMRNEKTGDGGNSSFVVICPPSPVPIGPACLQLNKQKGEGTGFSFL